MKKNKKIFVSFLTIILFLITMPFLIGFTDIPNNVEASITLNPDNFLNVENLQTLTVEGLNTHFSKEATRLSITQPVNTLLALYDKEIKNIKDFNAKVKKYCKISQKEWVKMNTEIRLFENTAQNLEQEFLKSVNTTLMHNPDWDKISAKRDEYTKVKEQYLINVEVYKNHQIYLLGALQEKYKSKSKVRYGNIDGIIVHKDTNSYYSLDLTKAKRFTISENKILIETKKKKKYFLLISADDDKFPTYCGLGIKKNNVIIIFDTSRYDKISGEMIHINDVIKFLLDKPKKNSLNYKDLVITKSKANVYKIEIRNALLTKDMINFNDASQWKTNSYSVDTKSKIKYFIDASSAKSGGIINANNAQFKFQGYTYVIELKS